MAVCGKLLRQETQEVRDQTECYLAPEFSDIAQMEKEAAKAEYKIEIIWIMVAGMIALHVTAAYGAWLMLTTMQWKTLGWMHIITVFSSLGVTGGAHRLWTHKSYKANFGVRLFLMIGQTMSIQRDIIHWSRDHRVHHKWSDCDADPHNISRGFFFAHMGWLMCKKHPKVTEMGKKVDLSDLYADPLLRFQQKYYYILLAPLSLLFLTAVPMIFWGETLICAVTSTALRLAIHLHATWAINSVAHVYGYKPFDTKISPGDNFFVAMLTNGEAWHNYHHTFPQDYRTSEYMWKANATAIMIDFFAAMGWVWGRTKMSREAVERQKMKGDHSRSLTTAKDSQKSQ